MKQPLSLTQIRSIYDYYLERRSNTENAHKKLIQIKGLSLEEYDRRMSIYWLEESSQARTFIDSIINIGIYTVK